MPSLMRSCDAFAFPSRYEACSLVMLEAMASGLPVITSKTTGGAELVPQDGGFLMERPDDGDGLVAILRRILDGRSDLPRLSASARERALTLSWGEMGYRYLNVLGVS
jgi:glycosyltransferase involved in cell wall biosynthesis